MHLKWKGYISLVLKVDASKVKIIEMLTIFIFATKWTQGVRATKHSLHLAKNKDNVMRTHTWTMMKMGNNKTKEDEHIQKVVHVGVIHNASRHVKEWRLIIL